MFYKYYCVFFYPQQTYCCCRVSFAERSPMSVANLFMYLQSRILFKWFMLDYKLSICILHTRTHTYVHIYCICVRFVPVRIHISLFSKKGGIFDIRDAYTSDRSDVTDFKLRKVFFTKCYHMVKYFRLCIANHSAKTNEYLYINFSKAKDNSINILGKTTQVYKCKYVYVCI